MTSWEHRLELTDLRQRLCECLDQLEEHGLWLAAARLDMAIFALDEHSGAATLRDNARGYGESEDCELDPSWRLQAHRLGLIDLDPAVLDDGQAAAPALERTGGTRSPERLYLKRGK